MNRWILLSLLVLCSLLGARSPVRAEPLDKTGQLAEGLRRSAWMLSQQRQRRSAGGIDPLGIRDAGAAGTAASQGSGGGLLPLALQLGTHSQMRFAYAMAGPDQQKLDPVAASLQGMGMSGDYGSVKSDSQFFLYRPRLDGGAAATLVRQYHQTSPQAGVKPEQLHSGQAFKQTLEMNTGSFKITGNFHDIDQAFAPISRLVGSDANTETGKRLQEMVQQRGTQRTSLGLTAGVAKGVTLTSSYDSLNDGAGRLRANSLGIASSLFKISTTSQSADAQFKGFKRFADPNIQKLDGQSGVSRQGMQWALTPSKTFGIEGARNLVQDGGGQVNTNTLGLRLGQFQYSSRKREVAGFKSFGLLADGDKALQKIVGVTLQENQASLGLGGKSRLAFAETLIADAGGKSQDRLVSFDSRSVLARARFRDVTSGFKSFSGLAEFDKQYKGLDQHRGQREAYYDLNYVGSKRFGLINHYEQADSVNENGQSSGSRTNWASTLNLNLGRTAAEMFRTQTVVKDAKGGSTTQSQERYQIKRNLQKSGFLFAEHQTKTVQDAQGKESTQQSDRLQTRLQLQQKKDGFFFAEHFTQKAQNAAGKESTQQLNRLQTRLQVQKDGFFFAERLAQQAQDIEGKDTWENTDKLQTKLQVPHLFALDGQRIERHGTGIERDYQDILNLSRSFGKVATTWNFTDRNNAQGFEQVQKLAVGGKLWKGLSLTSSREERLNRAAPAPGAKSIAPLNRAIDLRWNLTQEMGKAKVGIAFARQESGEKLKAAEQILNVQAPLGTLALTADFTQRQAAGKATAIVKGFTLADERKERNFGWRAQYRRRSASMGQPIETKGLSANYKSKGKNPLTLTTSYLRNAMDDKGVAHAGRLAAMKLTTGIGADLNLTVDYTQTADEAARKNCERTSLAMNGILDKDEKWEAGLSTQRTFEPAGASQNKRTRENTIHLKYTHGVGDEQAFELGSDLTFRTAQTQSRDHSAEYTANVRYVRSF